MNDLNELMSCSDEFIVFLNESTRQIPNLEAEQLSHLMQQKDGHILKYQNMIQRVRKGKEELSQEEREMIELKQLELKESIQSHMMALEVKVNVSEYILHTMSDIFQHQGGKVYNRKGCLNHIVASSGQSRMPRQSLRVNEEC